jgi:hypothetical protein
LAKKGGSEVVGELSMFYTSILRSEPYPAPDFLLAGPSRRDTTGIVLEKEKFQPPDPALAGLMRHAAEASQMRLSTQQHC